MRVAVIGAGMAGLTCGTRLREAGHDVRLFDKGRGPGGRMASRRAEVDGETLRFDHGAQYFTVSDDRFRRQVEAWAKTGIVAAWTAAKDGAWVGTPAMNAPIKAMADAAEVTFGARIEGISRDGEQWILDGAEGRFDALVVAIPAEQVGALVDPHNPDFAALAHRTVSDPCWTVMVAFDGRVDHGDTIRGGDIIGWAARDSAKPGRDGSECWVVQASPEWSREYLEEEAGGIAPLLLEHFADHIGTALPPVRYAAAHRWRYARCGNAGEGALWDADTRLGLCGDWLLGPRVECAYLSGLQLADRIGTA